MSLAIQFENISKQYRIGEIGSSTISHDLHRAYARLRGKPDPYAIVDSDPKHASQQQRDYMWALRDITLDVNQGEILGVIGHNGAGKSTLLKLLSRVTAPTTGEIRAKGRITSLLEVGTGFHPELTGRENVFLNGTILGMRKSEIDSQLDAIVEFSGCEQYLDTPVKRYSSGMTVRLGFAVAAHLQCDILIVDEVLAVGDASFQDRCLKKMNELSRETARTILFVSHNLNAVQSLCTSAVLLDHGSIVCHESTDKVIDEYVGRVSNLPVVEHREPPTSDAFIQSVSLSNPEYLQGRPIPFGSDLHFRVETCVRKPLEFSHIFFEVHSPRGLSFLSFDTDKSPQLLESRQAGNRCYSVVVPAETLKPGSYSVTAGFGVPQGSRIDTYEAACAFQVYLPDGNESVLSYAPHRGGTLAVPVKWQTQLDA